MINCLIVDDEPVARSIIRTYCGHLPFLHIAGECGHALEAKERLAEGGIDLLFLDIHMPVLNGVGFLSTLKDAPLVIFTTAYQEYAVNAFDLTACDYLLKPFSLERFIVAVDKAKEKLSPVSKVLSGEAGHFFIKAESKQIRVVFQDCMYAEAQGNYTKVVTQNATLQTKLSFSDLIAQLPPDLFIRVHRSFVVNKFLITHIEGNRVFIGKNEIPVAVNYREAFLKSVGIKKD